MEHEHKITNKNENKTLIIIIITIITMTAEITFGYISHSMALLADGFHMGTHALALFLTYIAYVLVRKYENSPLFPNGANKISILSAYTSAIFLGLTGIWIIIEAVQRLFKPLSIDFSQAILVATIGLVVNAICIFIMERPHKHNHEHEHNEDYNFLAAYYHILADALTSILAILALLVSKYFNLIYFDALVGILGGILIIKWAINLIKSTVKILIDMKE